MFGMATAQNSAANRPSILARVYLLNLPFGWARSRIIIQVKITNFPRGAEVEEVFLVSEVVGATDRPDAVGEEALDCVVCPQNRW